MTTATALHASVNRSRSESSKSGGNKPTPSKLPDLSTVASDNSGFAASFAMPVPKSSVLMVLNQLAVMTQNSIEIAEAIDAVAEHCVDDRLAVMLDDILDDISGGSTLSVAVARHGRHFPTTLAPMLAAAEATGRVPETLSKVSQRMQGEIQMRGTIIGALIYPALLVGTSFVVLTALVLGVLPQFGSIFDSMGRPVPALTRCLLTVGTVAKTHWIALAIGGLVTSGTIIGLRRSPLVTGPLARLMMYGPMIRSAYRPLLAGQNFRLIASMIAGGVPLLEAIRLTRRTASNVYWTRLLNRIEDALIDGDQASKVMFECDFLPPEAPALVAAAESSGRIAEVLEDIGKYYEEDATRRLKRLITMLEPVIILAMGVVVAVIVLSVMLPLMDISTIEST